MSLPTVQVNVSKNVRRQNVGLRSTKHSVQSKRNGDKITPCLAHRKGWGHMRRRVQVYYGALKQAICPRMSCALCGTACVSARSAHCLLGCSCLSGKVTEGTHGRATHYHQPQRKETQTASNRTSEMCCYKTGLCVCAMTTHARPCSKPLVKPPRV